jgi:hypothetical protein
MIAATPHTTGPGIANERTPAASLLEPADHYDLAPPRQAGHTDRAPAPAICRRTRPMTGRQLHCSEWWVKEQAGRRRIPFIWIGGRYLFTADHVAEIVQRFEVRPGGGRVHCGRRTDPAGTRNRQ